MIKSRLSHKNIKEMRKGDIIVAYQASEGVVGLVYLDSGGYPGVKGGKYNMFDMKSSPIVRLKQPVPLSAISDLLNAREHFEFVRVRLGTVFKVSPEGFEMIVELMVRHNPKQSKEIYEFLSNPYIVEAKIVAADELTMPRRKTIALQRIIRDSAIGKRLKRFYQYKCQVCGATIELPNGERYAEVHHLRPIGKPHNGKDGEANTIVVCPQHHAMFDLGAIAIDPRTLVVKYWDSDAHDYDIPLVLEHHLDEASLSYHYRKFFKGMRR